MPKNNDIRKQKYNQLLNAGFTAKDASKLRDAAQGKIDNLIAAKREAFISADAERLRSARAAADETRKEKYHIARQMGFNSKDARVLSKLNIDKFKKAVGSRIIPERSHRGIEYIDIKESPKHYLSKYTYKVSYHRYERNPETGRYEITDKEYITITKMHELTKGQVLEIARNILKNETIERYSPVETISFKSLKVEVAYKNMDLDDVI